MNKLLVRIVSETVFVGSLVAFAFYCIEPARNVFTFIAWFLAVIHLIGYCSSEARANMAKIEQGQFWRAYFFLRSAAVTVAAAWFSMPILATVWTLAWVLSYGIKADAKEAA